MRSIASVRFLVLAALVLSVFTAFHLLVGSVPVLPNQSTVRAARSACSGDDTGLKLPPGNHTVQLVNSRFGIDRTFSVEVRSGEVTKKKYDFPVDPK